MRKYNKIIDELMANKELFLDALTEENEKEAVADFNSTFSELTENLDTMTGYNDSTIAKMAKNANSLEEAIEADRVKKERSIYLDKEDLIRLYSKKISDNEISLSKGAIRKLYKRNFKPVIVAGGIVLAGALALGLKGCHKDSSVNTTEVPTTTEVTTDEVTTVEKTTEVTTDSEVTTEMKSEEATESVNTINTTNNYDNNTNTNTNNNNNNNNNKDNNKDNKTTKKTTTKTKDKDTKEKTTTTENKKETTTENKTTKRVDIDRTTTETKTENVKVPTTEAPATATTEENKPKPKTEKDAEKLTEEYPGDKEINEDKTVKPSKDEKSSIKDGESDEETYYFYEDIEASLNKTFKNKGLTLKLNC